MRKLKHSLNLLLIVLPSFVIFSCKLFETKDTTAPIVNLTIEGGNEISREVTLYLDIEDDSKIDEVSVIIGDSTYSTITSNFDTIKFFVNTYEDISTEFFDSTSLLKNNTIQSSLKGDQQLYVKAVDEEGNIGESEILDVVITEFPGWRKYLSIDNTGWIMPLLVDENGLVWIGGLGELIIFDPMDNSTRVLSQNNSELPEEYISDIVLVEGSRAWLIHDYHISEYHYGLDKWINVLPTPYPEYYNNATMNWCAILDRNYNLYIGTDGNYIIKYDGANFSFFEFPGASVFNMVYHPDNIIYYFDEWGPDKTFIKNDQVYHYDNIPFGRGMWFYFLIDSEGNLLVEGDNNGYYLYDGSVWYEIKINEINGIINPILCTKNGIIYATINRQVNSLTTFANQEWTSWEDYDTPLKIFDFGKSYWSSKNISEAPNSDIWMILDNELWRYRPSLGGYP